MTCNEAVYVIITQTMRGTHNPKNAKLLYRACKRLEVEDIAEVFYVLEYCDADGNGIDPKIPEWWKRP